MQFPMETRETAPNVLVGHSFGGLVIKSLVVEVHKASMHGVSSNLLERESDVLAKAFLAGLKGIVFMMYLMVVQTWVKYTSFGVSRELPNGRDCKEP